MPQAGVLSVITEFVGAVGLGGRVTDTIKNGIISIDRFREGNGHPGVLMLAMGCAEIGSAVWLMIATKNGWPVSTTQTVVGALIGVGFATQSDINWGWKKGSVSQVAASWGIAPLIAAAFSAIIFGTLKYSVLERKDPFKWAMRLIPVYFAVTGAILALFIVVEAPTAPSLEEFGAGKAAGIILGVFFGVLAICYIFFIPFFKRKLIMKDASVRVWHVPMGPLLLKEDVKLYFPGKGDEYVQNYYEDAYVDAAATGAEDEHVRHRNPTVTDGSDDLDLKKGSAKSNDGLPEDPEKKAGDQKPIGLSRPRKSEPYERFIAPVANLSWVNPQKWWGYIKFGLLQGKLPPTSPQTVIELS